jgi:hypothetical protein
VIDDEKVTVRAICGALGITFHPGRNSSYYLNAIYKAETQAAICTTLQFENTQLRAELAALRAERDALRAAAQEVLAQHYRVSTAPRSYVITNVDARDDAITALAAALEGGKP